jgi:hypothetical protein
MAGLKLDNLAFETPPSGATLPHDINHAEDGRRPADDGQSATP